MGILINYFSYFWIIFNTIATILELIWILIIFFWVVFGIFFAIKSYINWNNKNIYSQIRERIAHAILLWLEVLIAVDIIKTVTTEFTTENAITLGIIVLIRTILSISLEVEIEKRFPWQKWLKNNND